MQPLKDNFILTILKEGKKKAASHRQAHQQNPDRRLYVTGFAKTRHNVA